MQTIHNIKEDPMSTEANSVFQLQNLQTRINTLESQLEQTIAHSRKKEAYANTLATDLEHIIIQLKRLEVIR